jgi:redox-sensitive bicupin YhaK (pirin superfamily)
MHIVRKANERGTTELGWLDSRHTFSFGDYYDPRYRGFGALLVINDDRVAPSRGFGMHPHRDMEIISYVLEGALAHRDSMGNGSTIMPGDVQRMSAGTGITHSEMNPSPNQAVRFLQIWIAPNKSGLAPSYEQKMFSTEDKQNTLRLVASSDGRDGSVTVHQNVRVYASVLGAGKSAELPLAPGRRAWVQVARGAVTVHGEHLDEGDGLAMEDESRLSIQADRDAEILVFDLA